MARFLSSLLITAGNKHQGLQELGLAAQKGDLLKELAQAELVSAFLYFEKQPAKALTLALDLKEKFPQNYNFSFALANTLSELHRFPEALAIATRALDWFKSEMERFREEIRTFANAPTLFMGLVGENGGLEHYDGKLRFLDAGGKIVLPAGPGLGVIEKAVAA